MKSLFEKIKEFRKLTGKVVKGKENPFLKSKYADLNSVIEATDPALEEVGLIYLDRVVGMELHASLIDPDTAEETTATIPLILVKQDMQSLGSAITYARRYARMALFGLQAVDDDGSAAVSQHFITPKQIKEITKLMMETGTDANKFLSHYRVSAIKDMLEPAAVNAIATLKIKKEKES